MRTTLTLEPAVAERIQRIVNTRGRSMKDVVNEALREGLRALESTARRPSKRFVVEAHDFGVKPGIDPDTVGRLAYEMGDVAIAARLRRRKRG